MPGNVVTTFLRKFQQSMWHAQISAGFDEMIATARKRLGNTMF